MPRKKDRGTDAVPPTASLLTPQGMGGIYGGRGYAVQRAYAITRIPLWLQRSEFASVMIEAAGDVDILWETSEKTWRTYTQVKDRYITDKIFRSVLDEFISRKASSGTSYGDFVLAAKGFGGQVSGIVKGIERLRKAQPFLKNGGEQIVNSTRADLQNQASKCRLTVADLNFLLDSVEFIEIPGLCDSETVKAQFKGRLMEYYPTCDGPAADAIYNAVYELVGNGIAREVTRGELESVVSRYLRQRTVDQTGFATPLAVMNAVNYGTLAEVGKPFEPLQQAMNAHPYWRFGINLRPDGTREFSLQPRIPEALHQAPLKIRYSPRDRTYADLPGVGRRLYQSGQPITFDADFEMLLGDRTLVPKTSGKVTLGIPAEAVHEVSLIFRVTSVNGTMHEYYLPVRFRGTLGEAYGDNHHQSQSPVKVSIAVRADLTTREGLSNFKWEITEFGRRSAKECLKFASFMDAVFREQQPFFVMIIHNGAARPFVSGKIPMPEADPQVLEFEREFWSRVVELQQCLGYEFMVPEEVTHDHVATVNRLWGLFCQGGFDFPEDRDLTLHIGNVNPRDLEEILLGDNTLVLWGSMDSQPIDLFGRLVTLPTLRISFQPLKIKNQKVGLRALRSNRSVFDCTLVGAGPVKIREELDLEPSTSSILPS